MVWTLELDQLYVFEIILRLNTILPTAFFNLIFKGWNYQINVLIAEYVKITIDEIDLKFIGLRLN